MSWLRCGPERVCLARHVVPLPNSRAVERALKKKKKKYLHSVDDVSPA